jgi:type IV pilus assembly protein PilB
MILVAGPTGSGKTTTLYSMMNEIFDDDSNIMTVEEPVEFNMSGINQVNIKINEEDELAGKTEAQKKKILATQMTFAKALKAFLRQDPDKIMVGEIRDGITADIAIRAALTGHMVISSLHTNDAPSVVTRLMNIGAPYFLISASLTCVVAQKLIRKICPKCKKETKYSNEELEKMDIERDAISDIEHFYKGTGCKHCAGTGYYERTALFEVMPITRVMQELIMQQVSIKEIRLQAIKEGMMSLRKQGLLKVKEGVTTLDEVARATAGM